LQGHNTSEVEPAEAVANESRLWPLSLDALLLTALVLARAKVDTLSNAIVKRPAEFVREIPIVGKLMSDNAFDMLDDWMADPLSQIVLSTTFGLLCLYLVIDVIQGWPRAKSSGGAWLHRTKLGILLTLALFSVVGNTAMVMALRSLTLPSQFAHDGGVLEGDLAIKLLLEGKNVYEQDWRGTWVTDAFPNGPGLTVYPYLPFAFVPAVPIYLLTQAVWGWYDHRILYLIFYLAMIAITPLLARNRGNQRSLLALLALSPVLANDMIYGFNDILPVSLLVMAAVLYRFGKVLPGGVALGLAMATKGTVWPILPFLAIYLWRRELPALIAERFRNFGSRLGALIVPLLPVAISALLFIGPFFAWDAKALINDTIVYNGGGQVPDRLPIKGWGAANFVVATNGVQDLFDPYPFWILELIFAVPLIVALMVRQYKRNTLPAAFTHYGIGLFVFLYFSRTMNANYLGFSLAMLAIGFFADERPLNECETLVEESVLSSDADLVTLPSP
jgi:hypothetical protein